jgi:hypothetical protein
MLRIDETVACLEEKGHVVDREAFPEKRRKERECNDDSR